MSQLEAWEMVHVNADFLKSGHGKNPCITCHKGNPEAFDKANAHVGIVAAPSDQPDIYCDGCHAEVTANYDKSLHKNLRGYLKRIENRLGRSIENDSTLMGHFKQECGKCHASCGQCHVSRPVSVNGGFIKGHAFGAPDRDNNCIACHGSRVGAEYLGQNVNEQGVAIPADLHRYIPGAAKCDFCHNGREMHSSGQKFDYRYLNTDMPRCEGCHESAREANHYHEVHWANNSLPKLACQVCHAQEYKNCNGCHTGGQGITGSSYMRFKIAKNKFNPEAAGRDYDYVTVRHIPIVPDTYTGWGIADLPNYASEPTWKYATPHNIKLWTDQTDTTGTQGSCSANCHNSTKYYLTTDDLQDYEIVANKVILMDDKF